ncbi:MAG TPA: DUF3784 domain-containing protein [Moheibacter sp.]|nr:DUF3784 domain-containing protein [Moheibacter sp.]
MIENLIINFVVTLIFFLFGYLIKYKKKYELIAGFNDYSPNNAKIKKKYNMEKVGNVMGNSAFIYGITIIIFTLFDVNQMLVHSIALGAFFLNLVLFSKGFKNQNY